MLSPPKRPGDAVLSRDGTVKVDGVTVGVWEYKPPDEMPPAYSFAFAKGEAPVFSRLFKDRFKTELPTFLEGIGKLPDRQA